ncbi:hypothetical protein M2S00_05075 [Apilactobacillus sp. TMW 2.2459]|uniref:hypothetical protein n=1 Tax=Apilactobacillus xinyiensis TaxID=2841032 RepID=UPI001C7CB9D9|nr:hypothetical protein [Apilactobacillus xinyiensis]MCL0312476.1 hypothetical protein [Apilactobacillus xinyiensis]
MSLAKQELFKLQSKISKIDRNIYFYNKKLLREDKINNELDILNESLDVEKRTNGRLLEDKVFSAIWGIKPHNSYNDLLVQINIKSEYKNIKCKLPKTLETKSGIISYDDVLIPIYQWIHSMLPNPKKQKKRNKTI